MSWRQGLSKEHVRLLEEYARAFRAVILAPSDFDAAAKAEEKRRALAESLFGVKWGKNRPLMSQAYEEIARENPCHSNPTPTITKEVVLLGAALELELVDDRTGRRRVHKFASTPLRFGLFTDSSGRDLFIARISRPKLSAKKPSSKAARMWIKWSSLEVQGSAEFTVTDKPTNHLAGIAARLRYRSHKWTGKDAIYEHDFTGTCHVFTTGEEKTPAALAIVAENGKNLVTARGVVG